MSIGGTWRERTSNRPESTHYPTARTAAAAAPSYRPVPRTRALPQRPSDHSEFAGATDAVLASAEGAAKSKLTNQQGAHVVVSAADPSSSSHHPQPPQDLTVSWDLVPGSWVAHITDRSGVTSQCTYVSDRVSRSFALQANSTYATSRSFRRSR